MAAEQKELMHSAGFVQVDEQIFKVSEPEMEQRFKDNPYVYCSLSG